MHQHDDGTQAGASAGAAAFPAIPASGGNPSGRKWGEAGAGTPGGVVTWSLAGPGLDLSVFPSGSGVSRDPAEFLDFDVEASLRAAFAAWAAVADIAFVQVPDEGAAAGSGQLAQIRIFFGNTAGPANWGYGFYPGGEARSGDVLLQSNPRLNNRDAEGLPVFFDHLALHEISHAIGLAHSDAGTIMGPIWTPETALASLQPDDIGGIVRIYGAADAAPERYVMSAGRTDLRLLDAPEGLGVWGNALNNRIEGSAAAELVSGGAGDDTLRSGAGDDTLAGGTGADSLVGGSGTDLALVAGAWSADRLDFVPGALRIADVDGHDRLEDIERVQFDDGLLLLDLPGSDLGFVLRLYQAAFAREPGGGLLFWADRRADGATRAEIARDFLDSAAFAARYGVDPEPGDFVGALFSNVLGRPPGTEGASYWTGRLDDGLGRHAALIAFAQSPENRARTADALAEGVFLPDVIAELADGFDLG